MELNVAEALWTKWADKRPTDAKALYRWRVSPRLILGLTLQPEWTEKLALCGMGYAENELWPVFSRWDGYVRKVDPTLEWRLASPEEKEATWNGFDLLPCPHTGKAPIVSALKRWIGAPEYEVEWLGIKAAFVNSTGWSDAAKLRDKWNARASSSDAADKARITELEAALSKLLSHMRPSDELVATCDVYVTPADQLMAKARNMQEKDAAIRSARATLAAIDSLEPK